MSPLGFQGLDGAKGEKGVSGERGPSGPPVSVVSLVYPSGTLIPVPVMPLDPFLFHPGASWPARPHRAARNQRREGNDLPLMPPKYGHTFTLSLGLGDSTPCTTPSQSQKSGLWTTHKAERPSSSAPGTPSPAPHMSPLFLLREDPGSQD